MRGELVRERDRHSETPTVVSSAHLSVRKMPEGWIFSDKRSGIFTEDERINEMFLPAT
ncbi:MAG: hypothetical protein H0W16_05540 [Actinobacteria bacterium]|nr:hypothetical protein [Actinomycetota bacterium]